MPPPGRVQKSHSALNLTLLTPTTCLARQALNFNFNQIGDYVDILSLTEELEHMKELQARAVNYLKSEEFQADPLPEDLQEKKALLDSLYAPLMESRQIINNYLHKFGGK